MESEFIENPAQRFGAGSFAADEMDPGCRIFAERIQISHLPILIDAV